MLVIANNTHGVQTEYGTKLEICTLIIPSTDESQRQTQTSHHQLANTQMLTRLNHNDNIILL